MAISDIAPTLQEFVNSVGDKYASIALQYGNTTVKQHFWEKINIVFLRIHRKDNWHH